MGCGFDSHATHHQPSTVCGCSRIGTGAGLRIRWASRPLWVRVPPPAPCWPDPAGAPTPASSRAWGPLPMPGRVGQTRPGPQPRPAGRPALDRRSARLQPSDRDPSDRREPGSNRILLRFMRAADCRRLEAGGSWSILPRAASGCSSMVEPQPSKLVVRVRFPSPARAWMEPVSPIPRPCSSVDRAGAF